MAYLQQVTVQYKTFVKRSLVEALQDAWQNHGDPTVASAKVAIDFTRTDFKLPAVIIKFYESKLPNAGIGHYEWFPYPLTANPADSQTVFVQYQHRMYKGDIEFEIFGQSSADRDVLSDALIDVLAMAEVSPAGQQFLNRFYAGIASTPFGQWHFPTLNLDEISGYGETTVPPPWAPEDDLVYQTSYRVPIFGEFYSYTPPQPTGYGPISEVEVYEWPVDANGNPIDPSTPAPPVPDGDYQHFTGWPTNEKAL